MSVLRYLLCLIIIVALALLVSSCQDHIQSSGYENDVLLTEEVLGDSQNTAEEISDTEEDPCEDVGPHCGPEWEHQQMCWQSQLWFCTPDNLPPGDDPALYQQQVTFDVCNEDGVPCTPDGPNDPDCTWEVIHLGECEDWLECDPTNPDQQVQEDVPCEGVDANGDPYLGTQNIYCQKGQLIAGPCDPCEEEICDGVDNDCDGDTDEGLYPCSTECGDGQALCVDGQLTLCNAPVPEEEVCNYLDDDCDGEVDEGQLNACGVCGDVPEDFCNGVDDDCDGDIDEDLIQTCATICEEGYQLCLGGSWAACTAQPPLEEVCNGLDDDCDGQVDEGLDCQCPPEQVGFLIPCMEEPLICGQGYKTCECADSTCSATKMSPCYAVCHWMPQPDPACDPTGGMPIPEMCNNFDDDCDVLVDEDLVTGCYSGDPDTIGVGICHGGEMMCEKGKWGHYPENGTVFIDEYCLGEQLPLEEDLCSGQDDNCDGVIDKVIEDTDILFIVDTSGSMTNTINAVQTAMSMFAATYADEEVIQWGLIIGPVDSGWDEGLEIKTALVPFQQFLPHLVSVTASYSTGTEMLYDAVYLSILNLVDPASVLMVPQSWSPGVTSTPSLSSFTINWREDANRVVVVFTDEPGQSYLNPKVQKELIKDTALMVEDLFIYTFSAFGGKSDWESISVGGEWFTLTTNPTEMFDNLMKVVDETACGGSE